MRTFALVFAIHLLGYACDQNTDPATASATAPGSGSIIADERAIPAEADITTAALDPARTMAVVSVHPECSDALVTGLAELALADPARHSYRVAYLADRAWFAHGGLGHYQAATANNPTAHLAAFTKRIEGSRLDDSVQSAYLELDPRDFPDGPRAEVVYTTYQVGMSIDLTSASLTGTTTETLTAPRVLGNGNTSIFLGNYKYPLELPNLQVNHISTTLSLPVGGHVGDDDTVMVPRLSDRDPRVAINTYGDTMAALQKAHPGITFIYGTVPLTSKGNWQRNAFNQMVRILSVQRGAPLFDQAAILSREADGRIAFDEQGERLAPDYRDAATGGISKDGRARLAKAWWWLLVQVQRSKNGLNPDATVAAPLAAPVGVNEKVALYCQDHLNQVVGSGECSDLAACALQNSGAKTMSDTDAPGPGDYVWGSQVMLVSGRAGGATSTGAITAVRPGDVVQFRDTNFPNFRSEHHTAVVAQVDPRHRTIMVFQQNIVGKSGVVICPLSLDALATGWLRIYQPIPADE